MGEEGEMKWSEVAMREYGKEMVKQPSIGYQEECYFDLSEQLMSFEKCLKTLTVILTTLKC